MIHLLNSVILIILIKGASSFPCSFRRVLVSGLISSENVLNRPKKPLERTSLNIEQSDFGQGFNAGLSYDVFDDRQFSKVVSLFIIVDWLDFVVLKLFCHQLSFSHNIEAISELSLADDIFSRLNLGLL